MTLNNKANEAIIAMRRERVSQLVIRQLSVREIADALARGDKDGNGRIVNPETSEPYTFVTIASDIKALKKEWAERRNVNTEIHVDRQFAEMQEIKRAGWAAKDPELALKALRDEMNLLGTKKPQEININVTIIVQLIEAIERRGGVASEWFEEMLQEMQLADGNGS